MVAEIARLAREKSSRNANSLRVPRDEKNRRFVSCWVKETK
jgi:hypothetical protein